MQETVSLIHFYLIQLELGCMIYRTLSLSSIEAHIITGMDIVSGEGRTKHNTLQAKRVYLQRAIELEFLHLSRQHNATSVPTNLLFHLNVSCNMVK